MSAHPSQVQLLQKLLQFRLRTTEARRQRCMHFAVVGVQAMRGSEQGVWRKATTAAAAAAAAACFFYTHLFTESHKLSQQQQLQATEGARVMRLNAACVHHLPPVSMAQTRPSSTSALTPELAACSRRQHEGGPCGPDHNLDPSPPWQYESSDLDAAVVLSGRGDIEVPHQNVKQASWQTCAAARSSGTPLTRKTPERGHAAM